MAKRDKTQLVHAARTHLGADLSPVNPPLVRTSTVLFRNSAVLKDIRERKAKGERVFNYGTAGTSISFALEDAITEIEQGSRTMLFPSGLAAIAHTFLSNLKPGDHLLLAESIYGPARSIAVDYLAPRGIACEFYEGGHEEVARRLRQSTRMVYLDNPGSIVFDVQDVPAIAALCKGKGRDILVAVDNTWGAPGLYTPLALGADISVIAVTKYIAGHSDILMGSVTAGPRCADEMYRLWGVLGYVASPDDCYMALRGLRTARARMTMQATHAMEVAAWLGKHTLVRRVVFPALPSDPGHALWKRDFKGACSLFSFEFEPQVTPVMGDRFIDALEMLGIGASWGGYESLALTYPPSRLKGWHGNSLVRLHIGLEDPADIIADLEKGFAAIS
jgi:cystathionine beta-lyase